MVGIRLILPKKNNTELRKINYNRRSFDPAEVRFAQDDRSFFELVRHRPYGTPRIVGFAFPR